MPDNQLQQDLAQWQQATSDLHNDTANGINRYLINTGQDVVKLLTQLDTVIPTDINPVLLPPL